jgi:hypothetical protein
MKIHSHIVGLVILLVISIVSFKFIQKYTRPPVRESYKNTKCGGGGGNTCFDGKLSVPLPGRSKCFDCEREMIARNGCNINAGARGNSTRSFDAARHAGNMWGVQQYGMPTRSFFADSELIGKTPQYIF